MVAVVEKLEASTLMEHLCVRLVKLKATVSIMGKVEEKRRGDGEYNSLTSDVHAEWRSRRANAAESSLPEVAADRGHEA